MRWLRRIGLAVAVLLFVGLVASWDGLTGDREDPVPTTTTAAPGRVAAPIAGSAEDPRIACARALPPRRQFGQLLAVSVDGQAPDLEPSTSPTWASGPFSCRACPPTGPSPGSRP